MTTAFQVVAQTGLKVPGTQLRTIPRVTMILMLRVLLFLGLTVEHRTAVLAGHLPKPIIWAEPGSVIAKNTSVIIWCQGSSEAQEYLLHKEGSVDPWERQLPLKTKNKAKFCIDYMEAIFEGVYKCYYNSSDGLSEHSSTLELVIKEESSSEQQGHTVEDLFRIFAASLVLATLVILLLEAWYNNKLKQNATRRWIKTRNTTKLYI